MKSLIIYSSTDGQTKKICEVIGENFNNKEFIEILPLEDAFHLNINNYDQIILGASIRYGNYKSNLFKFIKYNIKILETKKNAFFSVNVVARKNEKNTPDTNPYIKKFLKKTNWRPKKIEVFAGKVDYPNYNLFNKLVIRLIMFITKGPTDISHSYEFTDWAKVKKFSKELSNY
tara:strand:- start:488 stop:1009 length:522 start_codon:yes stop_codon:yes gene_type:complete